MCKHNLFYLLFFAISIYKILSKQSLWLIKSWIHVIILWFQQQIWNSTGSDQRDDKNGQHDDEANDSEEDQTIGFNVKSAVFFPPEVEKSRWPEDYSLSDHARLTVVFSPTRMSCHPPK